MSGNGENRGFCVFQVGASGVATRPLAQIFPRLSVFASFRKESSHRRVHIFNRPISDDPTKSLGIKTEYNNIQLFIRGETSKVINPRVVVFPEGLSPRKYNLSRVGNLILTSYEGTGPRRKRTT
jgi:hypothetical protein